MLKSLAFFSGTPIDPSLFSQNFTRWFWHAGNTDLLESGKQRCLTCTHRAGKNVEVILRHLV